MAKIWRITLGFDPISTIDVSSETIPLALTNTIEWLKKQGNDVDETIILGVELLTETNELEEPDEQSTE
jgi:hypothetical protein